MNVIKMALKIMFKRSGYCEDFALGTIEEKLPMNEWMKELLNKWMNE